MSISTTTTAQETVFFPSVTSAAGHKKHKQLLKSFNKFFMLIFALTMTTATFAQQDAMFTQHMFNKLAINPAYAGSREATSITMLYRNQWAGFEGAPKTGTFTIHSPLRSKQYGLGLLVINDRLGLQKHTGVYGSYAYRMQVGEGKLSFGVTAGISHLTMDLVNAVHIDLADPNMTENYSRLLPNVGAGVYYNSEHFYAGVSIPHMVENEIIGSDVVTDASDVARQSNHYFGMLGGVVNINENLKFRPAALIKYAENSPVQADLDASLLINDVLWIGVTYRTSASVDAHIEFNVSEELRIGYAYDYVLNELGAYTSGSHELMVGFDFQQIGKRILTPRHVTPRYF